MIFLSGDAETAETHTPREEGRAGKFPGELESFISFSLMREREGVRGRINSLLYSKTNG
jgi:hypothetical protein